MQETDIVSTKYFELSDSEGDGFRLACGSRLERVRIAYETYGTLSEGRDNAILVFHALSGSQHLAGSNSSLSAQCPWWTKECHSGWWSSMVGPGKAIDTDKFFVICANYLGGCYGSTGPSSLNPSNDLPYGSSFPHLSVDDIVDTQVQLVAHLGLTKLHAVVGPSLGGMLGLNFSLRYPELTRHVVLIGCGLEVSVLQKITRFEQICAIEADPCFAGGDYYNGPFPERGLALARMIAHKSYVSLGALNERARNEMPSENDALSCYKLSYPIESYMLHQGQKFVKRFDANTYLRIAAAWQTFDLLKSARAADWGELFRRVRQQRYLVFSIDSDVCFYPEEQREIVNQLKLAEVPCKYVTVHSDKGHDSFLLEPHLYEPSLVYELTSSYS